MREKPKLTVEDAKERLRGKARKFSEFLNNPVGKQIVEFLEEEYYEGEMRGADPYQTYFNLGCREVIEYLHLLQRLNKAMAASENDDASGAT